MTIKKGSTAIAAVRKGSGSAFAKVYKGAMLFFSAGGGGGGAGLNADPTFANAAYWGAEGGGAVAGGVAKFNQPYVGSNPQVYHNGATYTPGATYSYSLTISNYSLGSVRAFIGAASPNYSAAHGANGTFTGSFTAGSDGGFPSAFGLQGGSDFIGDVDDFTLTLVP